jgi:peptidyl-prolyl cis-trans isomerase SurA
MIRTNNLLKAFILPALLISSFTAGAQQMADKIIGVVGKNRIILKSDLETQAAQAAEQDPNFAGDARCNILQQMILQKMLIEQAERDSVIVSPEEIDANLENRIRYYISLYGSKEKLEEVSGKTVFQLKDEYRDFIKDGMLAERVQGQILQNVKITPAEVQAFYAKIPADSLPFFPAMVEMGQIVMTPEVNPEVDQITRKKLEEIRDEITKNGKDFETMASLYSEDPGSRNNGGDLGTVNRRGVVPEFAAAAFKLQNGEISQIVKTKFGYHIIQMVRRKGEDAQLRHILIKPPYTSADYQKAMVKLDSIRTILVSGKITFQEAVGKYSTDEMSNRTGGMVTDPQTGATQLEIDKLDPTLALLTDTLKPGNYSASHVFASERGEPSVRIVYMKSISKPHKANLNDDYNKIQEVALQQKKAQKLNQWLIDKAPTYYLKVDPEYQQCEELKAFFGTAKK